MDLYCLTPKGIRVGYPSARLLRRLSRGERRRVQGRVVLALTANTHYALRGVRPGTPLRAARRHLDLGRPFHVRLNTWYLVANGPSRGVLEVRKGIVEEIGIANRQLTAGRSAARAFLGSFD